MATAKLAYFAQYALPLSGSAFARVFCLLIASCISLSLTHSFIDLQSLWLTSWFGSSNSNNNNSNWARQQQRSEAWRAAQDAGAGVYTLQQPHKFPLQLDVYSGNCSFDYHEQHEQPVAHCQRQRQRQHQQQKQLRQQREHGKLRRAASTAPEQSTLSTATAARGQRFLSISSDIDETKFIESSTATGKCKTHSHSYSHTYTHTHTHTHAYAYKSKQTPQRISINQNLN